MWQHGDLKRKPLFILYWVIQVLPNAIGGGHVQISITKVYDPTLYIMWGGGGVGVSNYQGKFFWNGQLIVFLILLQNCGVTLTIQCCIQNFGNRFYH